MSNILIKDYKVFRFNDKAKVGVSSSVVPIAKMLDRFGIEKCKEKMIELIES